MSAILDINGDLEQEIQTDKEATKLFPCVNCRRGCVVNRFKDPKRTLCTPCRREGISITRDGAIKTGDEVATEVQFEFNDELETEVLTDTEPTKEVPCIECKRRCVVTRFATANKVRCHTCRGVRKAERREKVMVEKAQTITADTLKNLENLADGILNPSLKIVPLCPFDPEHSVQLKYVCHNPNYGPRHYEGIDKKGIAQYRQETGEVVTYQCHECNTVISYSTANPLQMKAQNEAKKVHHHGPSTLEAILGVRVA